MFTECLSKLPETVTPFTLFPNASDRVSWEGLPAAQRVRLVNAGKAAQKRPWPLLTAAKWLAFSESGNRTDFEALYFARREKLCELCMAECAEGRGRFLRDIIDGVFLICEESAWVLPAHHTYERDAPPLGLPDPDRPILDLFACETGTLLAVTDYLLRESFQQADRQIHRRIHSELQRRILTPYLSAHFWWMGNGDEPMCNWTPWCTQNILLSALCMEEFSGLLQAIVRAAALSLDCFLKDYDDGCCDEGPQYYRHAGLCLFGCLELLSHTAPKAFSPLWQEKKIRNIAAYITNVHVADRYYINFADSSPIAGRAGAREYLFGKRIQNETLMAFASTDDKRPASSKDQAGINLFYRLLEAFTKAEMDAFPCRSVETPDIYYPSCGLFIARDSRFCLAVKAGHNGDNHNHNDTGSFTVYKDGKPFLIDIGVETYTAKTFSDKRYEIWTMQSSWHNLPAFDGVMQLPGKSFAATEVVTDFSERKSCISMQLLRAYDFHAGLRSYTRAVCLKKNRCITVTDRCEGSYQQAVLHLILHEKPLIEENCIRLVQTGRISINRDGGPGALNGQIETEEVPIKDKRLLAAWKKDIYRVKIPFHNTIELKIE